MYKLLKKIYRILIPNKFHYKIEPYIRTIIYYLFYKGKTVQCNICLSKSRKFIPISFINSKDKLCPKCGSLSRYRALGFYVSNYFQNLNMNILDFSPHRSILNFFKAKFPNYISSDYENQFFAKMKYDITNIDDPHTLWENICQYLDKPKAKFALLSTSLAKSAYDFRRKGKESVFDEYFSDRMELLLFI